MSFEDSGLLLKHHHKYSTIIHFSSMWHTDAVQWDTALDVAQREIASKFWIGKFPVQIPLMRLAGLWGPTPLQGSW